LIELLVVIAILAVLAAILFPVFSTGARERRRRSACLSNVRRSVCDVVHTRKITSERTPFAALDVG
jgi:prepilin-type N-terminal cleavage/methylation domain-containing protein